jgi:hypothetical protein
MLKTKAERRAAFGPALWIGKPEAAAITDESIWSVDQKIKRRVYRAQGRRHRHRKNLAPERRKESPQI